MTLTGWDGNATFECEATTADGHWLSLYVGPVQDCPFGRWLWSVDTQAGSGEHDLRPLGLGVEYGPEPAKSAAEEAARRWFYPNLELVA